MKIGNLIALLVVAAGLTCSTPAQTPQAAAAKQKTPAPEKSPAVDLSKVRLQEGIHEIYRDKKLGLKIFSVVKDAKVAGYFSVDQGGEVQTLAYNPPVPSCGGAPTICIGPPHRCVLVCLPMPNQ